MARQYIPFNYEDVPVSKSGIHMYKQCPKRFEYMVIRDLGFEDGDLPEAMVIGTEFHDAAEHLYDKIDKEAILSGRITVTEEYRKYMPYVDHWKNFIDMEQKRFDALGGAGKVNKFFFPLHRELYMEDRELNFYGTLDRIDRIDEEDEYVVIDYKVSKVPKHQSAYSKYRLELAGYAHLVEVNKIVPKPVKYIGIMFMKTNEETGTQGGIFIEKLKDASRAAFHRNLKKVQEGVRARMLDANPGWNCQYCPYTRICAMENETQVN